LVLEQVPHEVIGVRVGNGASAGHPRGVMPVLSIVDSLCRDRGARRRVPLERPDAGSCEEREIV
jgi:hypothetical protein